MIPDYHNTMEHEAGMLLRALRSTIDDLAVLSKKRGGDAVLCADRAALIHAWEGLMFVIENLNFSAGARE